MISGIFRAIEVSATGLSAQRQKMNVVSENVANAQTTRTAEGGPYRRQRVRFDEQTARAPFRNELRQAATRIRQTRNRHLTNPARAGVGKDNVSLVDATTYVDPNQITRQVYEPGHPDADPDGFVAMPDINVVTEMVEMMISARAYEANLTAVETAKNMAERAINL